MFGSGAFGAVPYGSTPVAPTFPTAGASERVWFLTGIESDTATLADVGTAQMAVANLQDYRPSKKWRATGTSAAITIALDYPVAANSLAWIGHNHTSAGVYRLRGADTAGAVTTAPVVDTNWQSVWPLGVKPAERNWLSHTSLLRFANTTALQYWRLDVADTGTGITDLQAGRLMLGVAWQPSLNLDFGLRLGITNSDVRRRSPWGAIRTSARPTGRTFALSFSDSEESDAIDHAQELQRVLSAAGDLVCSIDPAATDRFHRLTMHGVLAETGDFEGQPLWNSAGVSWRFALTLDELIF